MIDMVYFFCCGDQVIKTPFFKISYDQLHICLLISGKGTSKTAFVQINCLIIFSCSQVCIRQGHPVVKCICKSKVFLKGFNRTRDEVALFGHETTFIQKVICIRLRDFYKTPLFPTLRGIDANAVVSQTCKIERESFGIRKSAWQIEGIWNFTAELIVSHQERF